MFARRAAASIGALILGLVSGGCSDAGESGAPAAPTSTTPATETASDPSPTGTAEPAPDYVMVPPEVTLSEPGSRLELKDQAVAGWTPRQDLVGVVEMAVTRIESTTIGASLADYELAEAAGSVTPYFVHTKVTNVGVTDLGGRQLPLYAISSDGSLVAPTGIEQDFAPCSGSLLPPIFAPDAEAASCLIFLVPEGDTLDAVMFRPPEGVVPLTWSGEIRSITGRGAGGRRDRDRGGDS